MVWLTALFKGGERMVMVEACVNLITEFYESFYGNINDLKEKYINQYWVCSDIKKKSLIERFRGDYDFLMETPESLGINLDDVRYKSLSEYLVFFKCAIILLSNDVNKSDFINPFTGKQAIPHDIAEAKMYIFDASSPKEAVEIMNNIWHQKKKHQKQEKVNNYDDSQKSNIIADINRQFDDVKEELTAVHDDLEYNIAFCDMTIKLGEFALAAIEAKDI